MDAPCHLKLICVDQGSPSKIQNRAGHGKLIKITSQQTCICTEGIIEGMQRGEANVDVKFQRIWFGIAFTGQGQLHLVIPVMLPNWANPPLSNNKLPITWKAITAAAQASV